jgi:RNA polymerase subunit RPABC4/transcription elongation factor Spt4
MIKCKKCGAEMPDGTYFCEKCGEAMYDQNGNVGSDVSVTSESKFCQSCGEKLETSMRFCPKCGAKVFPLSSVSAAAPAPIPAPTPAISNSVSFVRPEPKNNAVLTPPRRPSTGKSQVAIAEFYVSWNSGSTLKKAATFGGMVNGGSLKIYADRVEFVPGKMNIADKTVVMPMDEIASVSATDVAFVIPNGVKIVMRSGQEYVVMPKIWEKVRIVELIQAQLHRA